MSEQTIPSTCWECNVCCGSLITMKDGAVAKIGPNPKHPNSKGAFCVKGIRALKEWTEHDNRLRYPMRRVGERGSGQWERIGWDEAFDEMATRFAAIQKRYGNESLVGAVSGAYYSRGLMVALLMRSLGSPNWMINQDLCGGCRSLSDKVTGLGITRGEDIDNTSCALIVGRNPQAADPVEWIALKAAKERGARIVVIDPVRSPAADLADLWLAPKPGTDAAIGLAMIHVLISEGRHDKDFVSRWCDGFDALAARAAEYPPDVAAAISGVPAGDIVAAARHYADGPSTFVSGHGIDAFSNGFQTFRAFHALVAISGNLDRPGGNRRVKKPKGFRNYLELLHAPEFQLSEDIARKTVGADRYPLWAGPEGWQTACHNPSVIAAMLTGKPYPVRGAYISGVNIVITYPDAPRMMEALKSLDYVVVASQHMTPTAALADLILPKTTSLEEEEVALQPGGPCVTYTNPVMAPRGEARCDLDIARGLLDRMAADGNVAKDLMPWPDMAAFNRFLLEKTNISIEELRRHGFVEFDWRHGDHEDAGFPTPSKKIQLFSTRLAEIGVDPLPNYVEPGAHDTTQFPLILQTGAREKTYHHSRFRDQAWARKVSPAPWARLHPDTAAAQGLNDGDWVRVETPDANAACRLKVEINDRVPPGMVSTGMGWWLPESQTADLGALDININAALSYGPPWDPVTGSADTRGLPCRLSVLPAA